MTNTISVEMDYDTVDQIAINSLKESLNICRKSIEIDLANLDEDSYRWDNIKDNLKTIKALKCVLYYYTGEEQ